MAARWVPGRRDIIRIDFNRKAGREMKEVHPRMMLSPQGFNERTSIVVGLPMTTGAYIDSNPLAISFSGPRGERSYVLTHQPKSLDWKVRKARAHPWIQAPEVSEAACETLNQIVELWCACASALVPGNSAQRLRPTLPAQPRSTGCPGACSRWPRGRAKYRAGAGAVSAKRWRSIEQIGAHGRSPKFVGTKSATSASARRSRAARPDSHRQRHPPGNARAARKQQADACLISDLARAHAAADP